MGEDGDVATLHFDTDPGFGRSALLRLGSNQNEVLFKTPNYEAKLRRAAARAHEKLDSMIDPKRAGTLTPHQSFRTVIIGMNALHDSMLELIRRTSTEIPD